MSANFLRKIANTSLLSSVSLAIASGALCVTVSHAKDAGWELGKAPAAKHLNAEYHTRWPLQFNDDITPDQSLSTLKLTPDEQHQAAVWGLSQDEEKRYVLLMRNRSGRYFKDTKLTPIEILGINARTDKERSHYAEIDAQQEAEKNAKMLAFNARFHQAAVALQEELKLPIVRPFDFSKYSPYNYQPMSLASGDVLMFFVKSDQTVTPILSYLLSAIMKDSSIHLNVYFIDNPSHKVVEDWASGEDIPPKLVQSGVITLNLGDKQFSALPTSEQKTPMLVRIRSGRSTIIDTGRF